MRYLKINSPGEWQLDKGVAIRLLEIDAEGNPQRYVDLSESGKVMDHAPSSTNSHGVIDHPPLSTESDWTENLLSKADFDAAWLQAEDS
jgi:hypothetical protein